MTYQGEIVLSNGITIPKVGYGVWKIESQSETERCVATAIELGYRYIDTAVAYGNEVGVGRGIKQSGAKRSDLFITSKISSGEQKAGLDNEMLIVEESLERLQLEYIDLYLIHWPLESYYRKTWKTLIEAYENKRLRAIGVSNCTNEKIDILVQETGITPMVNQLEIHPVYYPSGMINYCKSKGIALIAYSPLMQGQLDHSVLLELAQKHQKTPAQIVLRWHWQNDIIAIPKTLSKARMEENLEIFNFQLSSEDMVKIQSLNRIQKILPYAESIPWDK